MIKKIKHNFRFLLMFVRKNFLNIIEYQVRHGLLTGMKRKGESGFIPFVSDNFEESYLKKPNFEGKVVYDIGGHEGVFTLFFSYIKKAKYVYTFETSPINF